MPIRSWLRFVVGAMSGGSKGEMLQLIRGQLQQLIDDAVNKALLDRESGVQEGAVGRDAECRTDWTMKEEDPGL